MALPIANFGFSRNNLTISFINNSLNLDGTETYSWDFGDGQTNTTKNPSHTYNSDGFFVVSLTTTIGTDNNTTSMNIGVGSITNMLNVPLLKYCLYYLPSTLLLNTNSLVSLIQTWQIYLQPLVENPLVDINDTHNEFKWPALVNKLIAMLVAKDIMLQEANSFLVNLAKEGNSGNSSNTDGSASPKKYQKIIETGPTKVEWFEGSDANANSDVLKNIADSMKRLIIKDGLVDKLSQNICNLSKRLNIYLPDCGKLNISPRAISKSSTPEIGSTLNSQNTLIIDNLSNSIGW